MGSALSGLGLIIFALTDFWWNGGFLPVGVGVIVLGVLLSWVGNLLLCGFGELVENSSAMVALMKQNNNKAS